MSVAEVNGQRISFTDHGGDGPAVIFSHGFLMDGSMFDLQVEALKEEFRCVTWDERGHGGTLAETPFTYWDSTDDALGLLTHLGIEQATFAGMSQGGFIAMRAALRAPERVRALVLIDTQSGLEDPEALPLYLALRDEWVANGPAAVQDAVAALIFGPGIDTAPWYAKWAALDRTAFNVPFDALVERDEITDRLGEITQPTLIIHGSADAAIPLWRAEQLRDGIPGVRQLVVVEGAGHASNMSQPGPAKQVNQAMAAFLHSL
ncbi:MAG TPA: alpha/beta fold hydrolase [Acidimicrobiales bacterium]|jgi:pimeloyl-ACP methyl ester carboxylesterase|nr:alpha/beta fold hydrolase [Acidimicrobiales bacterium]